MAHQHLFGGSVLVFGCARVMHLRLLGVIVWLAVVGMATVGPSMAAPVTYQYQGPNFTSASGVYRGGSGNLNS